MSRKSLPPSYRFHKARNSAVSTIDGKNFYLGAYGSLPSYSKYLEVLAGWITKKFGQPTVPAEATSNRGLLINGLILGYWEHAKVYYVKNGQPTDEQFGIQAALRPLRQLFGHTPVADFGPLDLKVVRESLIEADLSRKVINQYTERIKRMFKWGVENELVPPTVYQALAQVAGLRKGRSRARETGPVQPVSDLELQAVLPHLSAIVRAMVEFQRLTGCRPTETCLVRPCDIERSGRVWCYHPESHKTEHHGSERRIYIGPQAQMILTPLLLRPHDSYCFNPRESSRAKRPAESESRSEQARPRQTRRCGDRYTSDSYRRAITRACERAEIPPWSPNQLRHSRATELRQRYGLEAAQTVLGHRKADVTEIYAERDFQLAERVMAESG